MDIRGGVTFDQGSHSDPLNASRKRISRTIAMGALDLAGQHESPTIKGGDSLDLNHHQTKSEPLKAIPDAEQNTNVSHHRKKISTPQCRMLGEPLMLDGRRHMLPNNLWQFLIARRSRSNDKGHVYYDSDDDDGGIFDPEDPNWVDTWKRLHQVIPDHARKVWADHLQRKQEAQLRLESPSDWLWVDALCIDQTDLQERMHQVRIMSQIFRGAKEVLVWLGTTNKEVDDLMGWWSQGFRAGSSLEPRRNHIVGLRDLCERPYWSRLWVFQELKSAENIMLMCGCHRLPWTTFGNALTEAPSIGGQDYTVLRRDSRQSRDNAQLESLKYLRLRTEVNWERRDIAHQKCSKYVKLTAATKMIDLCMGSAPTSLWLLLQRASYLRCHDPRDKVYAILSMTKTRCDEIDADYELPLLQLIHHVLSNSYANCPPQSVHDVAVRCARLKAMMGLNAAFPWGADEYFAAEHKAHY